MVSKPHHSVVRLSTHDGPNILDIAAFALQQRPRQLDITRETIMKLLNRLAKPFRYLLFGLLTSVPLLSAAPVTFAANQQSVDFSQAELDQMLAPIALYPDALLSQVLIASTYPLEIVQADRWVRNNKDLKTDDALKFAENKDWDPSVKALVAFPDVLHRMSDDVDWTQRMGDAFLSDEDEVMDAVQRLRKRAYATGNLDKAQHISVEQEDNNIVIEPAVERVVYVPVYDTRVVYGNWWWPDYPPVYWNYPSSYTYVSGFYWGSSIYVGPSYFYSSCQWRDRRVVVIDRNTRYVGSPHFYTGRSIVRFNGARQWQHDPVHRHGVAYYNNNLRETYGSRHESYQNARDYREQHREISRPNGGNDNRDPRLNRSFGNDNNRNDLPRAGNGDNNSNTARNFDRSEQVRERLNRQNNGNGDARPQNGNGNNTPRDNLTGGGNRTPIQGTEIRNDNNPTVNRPDNGSRSGLQRRIETTNNTGTPVHVNQERRTIDSDNRPNFSAPQRVVEQRANTPQPTVERRDDGARREFSAPRVENQNQNQQRADRVSRVGRDRDDDKTK